MTEPHRPITAAGPQAVAANVIGAAFTGDPHLHLALPPDVVNTARDIAAPPGAGNLALEPNCVGREDELSWLRHVLTTGGGTAVSQPPTIHGLGGIGKTTLALTYAHRHRRDYALIWWINAESPNRIEQSLAALAVRLYPAWAGKATEKEGVAWAMAWLQWHPGWLLVYDNAEAPRDLDPYLSLAGGHHLITTRRTTGWRSVPTYELGALLPDEATELLLTRALGARAPRPRERHEARTLAAEFGYLPLALDQAGAYLAEHPTVSIDVYRRSLDTKLHKAADGTDPERTIARIWAHTVQTLQSRSPLAVTVLNALAWLAPDDIPVTLLRHAVDDAEDLDDALALLRTYSMITLTSETAGIHRLVQTVLRTAPDRPGRAEADRALAGALDALPKPGDTPAPDWDSLIPHLSALAATASDGHHEDAASGHYETAAAYLHRLGREAGAIHLLEATVARRRRSLGPSHPDTLASRNNLATAYHAAGNLRHAITILESTLARRTKALGDTHPDTLTTRTNLAFAYQETGDLDHAIPLFEAGLGESERALGANHPDALSSSNNLAAAYQAAGDFERAIPLHRVTLTLSEQALGPTHPHTLTYRNNLATAYQAAGNLDHAVELLEKALDQCEETLGDTHPDTLTSRNNLATAYHAAGDFERAVPLLETTLAQREQLFGETHPHTLTTRNNLGRSYASAGFLERAVPLLEATLTQREQLLGDVHPHTLTTRNELAHAHVASGAPERAIPLYETTLTQAEQTLGPTHRLTLAIGDGLTAALAQHGTSRAKRRWWQRWTRESEPSSLPSPRSAP
ncbi:FxSxx-COOH system tetratricopeptide repeat protein [Kitasatospora sp. NPDC058218]|uniref:FxSxx-COOH system tetratricopeptide repeat protein n=1 Tax=Kitasatospora sp. NPDC058218 TaxID=3346385 RepID=UPI0036D88387